MNRQVTLRAVAFFSTCLITACGGEGGSISVDGATAQNDEPLLPGHVFTSVVASGQTQIVDIAPDEQDVYWLTAPVSDPAQSQPARGLVARASKLGGRPSVLATGQVSARSIAVNDTSVFWSSSLDGTATGDAGIFTRSKFGGRVARFAPTLPPITRFDISYLLADDQQLYSLGDSEILYRIPIFGQSPKSLVISADHATIALDRNEVFLSEGRNCSGFVAEIPKNAPATDESMINPAAAYVLDESTVCLAWAMAVSGSTLYWISLADGIFAAHLHGAPTPPDAPITLVPPDVPLDFATAPQWLAVVPPYLYWSTGDGKLKRVLQTGGAVSTVIASGVNPTVRLAADSDSVYWATTNADKIERTRVR